MTTDAVSGVWAQSLELARTFRIFGIETILAVIGPPLSAPDVISAQDIPGLILVEANFRLEWMEESGADIERAGAWLLDLEAEYAPDIVHLNSFAYAVLPWRAPCLVAVQGCLGAWWPQQSQEAAFAWSAFPTVVDRALKTAKLVVTGTASGLARLEHQFGPLPNGRVIAVGRNPGDFIPAAQEDVVATAGRCWDAVYNVGQLDSIAGELPWPVLAASASDASIDGSKWLPLQARRRWLSQAAIFALPASGEPMDSLVLEAGYSGCALVLGDIPAFREIWNGAAVFVQPHNAQGLKAEIIGLIHDPGRRRVLGRLAARRARKFTAMYMASGYIAAYSEMLRGIDERLDRPERAATQAIA